MACAAGADVIAWGVLALVVAVVAGGGKLHALGLLSQMLLFTAILAFGGRRLLRVMLLSGPVRRHHGELPLLIIIVGLLLSAWVTTELGFQPIFGGFAFGAIVPREAVREVAPEVPLLIEQASMLLVPVFFVTTGLSVNLSHLGTLGFLEALLVLVVACTGKFFGAAGAARLCGFDSRRASAVGVLMNSRGLTELVVIQVGITLGILSERLASIMIIMAILTTVAATPLFRMLYNDQLQVEDNATRLQVPAVRH
jgi:Kef-type K+ transport system membrane component KefB